MSMEILKSSLKSAVEGKIFMEYWKETEGWEEKKYV